MGARAFDKTQPPPTWLRLGQDLSDVENENYRRGLKYYQKLWQAQPAWVDRSEIHAIYRACEKLRRENWPNAVVDHIVPLSHPLVCGLHVPWNLRIVDNLDNSSKSNHTWPGKWPPLQADMFAEPEVEECRVQQSLLGPDGYLQICCG